MNAKPIHPAGIVLRKTFLSCGDFPVSHHQYIVSLKSSVPEDGSGQSYVVSAPPCQSVNNK